MTVPASVAAGLLGYAASTDNRDASSEEAARGWAAALDEHVSLTDGKVAIDRHRATSTDWLMPAHINAEVRRIRRSRTEKIGADELPPAELDGQPAHAITWTREYRRAIGDGDEPEQAAKRACAAVGIAVPEQLEADPRPGEVRRLLGPARPQCECDPPCLSRHVRREEGKAS